MGRGDLTDQQWQQLQPLLPPQKPTTGRPAKNHRTIINGILWVLRTGAPWRDLPERYGPWRQPLLSLAPGWTVGSFAEVSTAAVQHPREGELGTSLCGWHHSSGPSARGGSQGENPEGEALGRSQGGFSTKVHLRAEGGGKLITLVLTPGQRHEAPVFPQLMAQGSVKGAKGRPRLRPRRVVGDSRINECRKGPFDREVYNTNDEIKDGVKLERTKCE